MLFSGESRIHSKRDLYERGHVAVCSHKQVIHVAVCSHKQVIHVASVVINSKYM